MPIMILSRRAAILGACAGLGGCSAVSSINAAATPLDTYELSPASGSPAGRRSGQTLAVAEPDAPASVRSDRIMVKPGAASVTYLPDARWSDEVPAMVQSLLVRSIAGTGQMGYVGPAAAGPVPDLALLSRIDAFHVEATGEALTARIDISLTLLRDGDQRVIKTEAFRNEAVVTSDTPDAIVAGFQAILDALLPQMAKWVSGG